ncbi:MAG: outer membrane beta-barrel family protein [Rikenellaceae bacterium]
MSSNVYTDGDFYDSWVNNSYTIEVMRPSSQANLYYTGTVKKLSIDFNTDYTHSHYKSFTDNDEVSDATGSSTLINSYNNVKNSLWAAKLILSYPIWKGNLSIGSEYVIIDRLADYVNEQLPEYSSKVDIDETNLALFAEYQFATKIGNFNLGMRFEDASYDYITDDVRNDEMSRTYKQWFPSATYSNTFGKVTTLLSYTSKVVRPTYSQLSNSYYYGNSMTLQTGNPYLNPTIKKTLSAVAIWKKVQASISYTNSKDAIIYWADSYENDSKVTVISNTNIDKLPSIMANISYSPKIGIWNPEISGGVTKDKIDVEELEMIENLEIPLFFSSLNNTFELPNDFMVNLDFAFQSKGCYQAGYCNKATYNLGFGISKHFFNKALQVKLGVSDILNSAGNFASLTLPKVTLKQSQKYDSRVASINIRYNFNSAKSKYKGNSAGQDAMNRF